MTVYTSPSCGRCNVLKEKLKAKNIVFVESDSYDTLIEKGYTQLPVVEFEGDFYSFGEAIRLIDEF